MPEPAAGDLVHKRLGQGLVYGWASVASVNGEPVVDWQGDTISEDELVKAAHAFVTDHRTAGVMHTRDANGNPVKIGDVVESVVLTRDLQKTLGRNLPITGWLVGCKITDPATRARVASGELRSFSIGGIGRRESVTT